MATAAILSQGDEVVTGQTVDTNAAWLAEQLTELGVDVVRHLTVGDRLDDLVEALRDTTSRVDVVICTGGLGPTDDDLTAEACAAAFDRPLELDEEALTHLQALYARFGRPMAASNRKQALLPGGSARLDNARGTAPGFAFHVGPALLACLPGVPSEMRHMFREQVLSRIRARLHGPPGRLVVLRTTGVGESVLQDRIGHLTHPDAVLGYRTMLGENQIKLRFRAGVTDATIRKLVNELRVLVGSSVFSVEGMDGEPGGSLVQVVARRLLDQGATLSLAESCTGGLVASLCTSLPGSSDWFLESCVTYANAAKERRLGVPAALLALHGAVSEPVARAMAEGIRRTAGSTYGVGVTGIAGPGGGSDAKPIGTVHLALATPHGTHHHLARLAGDRARIQGLAAHAALDLLRRQLEGTLPSST